MKKVEGWDCGIKRHLHPTEEEAQHCHDQRERRKRRMSMENRARDAGWIVLSLGETTAVNTRTGVGRVMPRPTGHSLGDEQDAIADFIEDLLRCPGQCKICEARCMDGTIMHGKGCYHISKDGGDEESCNEIH